jgi:hypothetical protein
VLQFLLVFLFLFLLKIWLIFSLKSHFPCKATTGLEPIGYRGTLLSSLLQVNVYVTKVLVQIANKMGFKKNRMFYNLFSSLLVAIEVSCSPTVFNLRRYHLFTRIYVVPHALKCLWYVWTSHL